MATTCLGEFIHHMPCCSEASSLACLESCFADGKSERVVITDEQHRPTGIVRLSHWLAYWSQFSISKLGLEGGDSSNMNVSDDSTPENTESSYDTPLDVFVTHLIDKKECRKKIQTLIKPSGSEYPSLNIDPVAVIPADWDLVQFREHSLVMDSPYEEDVVWVVVDHQGIYVGVLDECAVWRSLAHNSEASGVAHASDSTNYHIPTIKQRDTPGLGVPPYSDRLLAQLIDNLPLPLMIQTADGRLVIQNQVWLQFIDELQNSEMIWQQIATLFGHEHQHNIVDDSGLLSSTILCELGNDSNQCVCTCSMTDGHDRTWQFTKVPLTATRLVPPFPVEQYPLLQSAIASSFPLDWETFQLARLEHRFPTDSETVPLFPTLDGTIRQTDQLWLISAQDITSQHHLNQSLTIQNESLLRSNRLKDEFLNCITHELKTPLTAMLGLSSLLKDHAIGTLNERQTQYARLIYKSGRQLVSLVNNILELTRLEAGNFQLSVSVIDIRKVCEQAYKEALGLQDIDREPSMHRGFDHLPELETQRRPCILHIPTELQYAIADSLRLKQILVQLLSNALKFSDVTGDISVAVNLWGKWLAFTVTDTGIGIPKGRQHLILQKSHQLECSSTHTFEGAGLGLLLAQKLAEIHGGDISFVSQDGKGSQFTLLLPFSPYLLSDSVHQDLDNRQLNSQELKPEIVTIAQSFTDTPTNPNCLVVLVGTEPMILDAVIDDLDHFGYQVVVARSETEAVKKIQKLQPIIVLIDMTVTTFMGCDLLSRLKSDVATRHIPVITMSAVSSELERERGLSADVQLRHPVSSDELQQTLNRLIVHHENERVTSKPITVLYFNPEKSSGLLSDSIDELQRLAPETSTAVSETPSVHMELEIETLNSLLHPFHCRVLEVEDLAQAGLLSRVWSPDVILFSNLIADYENYLTILNQNDYLSKIPIITLTPEHTEAANRTETLKVFPCLNFKELMTQKGDARNTIISPLVEVIQIAVGVHRIPRIIVIRVGDLTQSRVSGVDEQVDVSETLTSARKSERQETAQESQLCAFVHYLQTAGIHVSIDKSLDDIVQHMTQRSIDLLLLYYDHPCQDLDTLGQNLEQLRTANTKLPVLVWADTAHAYGVDLGLSIDQALYVLFKALNIEVIDGNLPMNDVLAAVRTAIAKN